MAVRRLRMAVVRLQVAFGGILTSPPSTKAGYTKTGQSAVGQTLDTPPPPPPMTRQAFTVWK